MATLTAPHMPKTPKRNDRTVRIDEDLAILAGVVAAYRDQSLNVYLTEVLRPIVEKHHADEVAKLKRGPK